MSTQTSPCVPGPVQAAAAPVAEVEPAHSQLKSHPVELSSWSSSEAEGEAAPSAVTLPHLIWALGRGLVLPWWLSIGRLSQLHGALPLPLAAHATCGGGGVWGSAD